MVGIARVLRHRLPIQDRFVRVKLVKNCFSGADMVDGIVNHLECSRNKAVEIGKELARKHFIHHVFRENDFEDGAQSLYRFLEHDPAVPRYYNFRGSTNDGEPKPAAAVGQRMAKIMYVVGGYPYSLTTIKNGILRGNRRQPYTIVKPFGASDKRLELAETKVNPLVHFALCNATRSSPTVRFYSTQGVEPELRHAAREFLLDGGVEIDLETRTVHLTRIIKWYSADFGQDRDILRWIFNYLDPTKAGLLTHLLNDGGPISIAYQDYDWSLNA
ncbi:unnamed protein product [Triticum turgidum subsp. durum]|uniref:DEP domain-containing protein n=1 Tax=Triticum turgidum subsp. durum TaxID=4567 RepID=A0A9R0Q695_TRITD|nr:unnamed protein product [Triticum turgidum subsp. durum]